MMPLVRRWTEADIEKLRLMAEAGASAMKCAAALRRPTHSVKKQARNLGLSLAGVREVRAKMKEAELAALR